jgi:hypothetical protein
VRLDHLLSKEYMSSDRACTIAMAYKNLKSTTDLCHPEPRAQRACRRTTTDIAIAEESIDQLDRKAGGDASRLPALFSLEGMNLHRFGGAFLENCIEKNFHVFTTST